MKSFRFVLVILLAASIVSLPSQSVISTPDEYASKLDLFEEFVKGQMEKDKIPGLTIGFTKDKYMWVKASAMQILKTRFRPEPNPTTDSHQSQRHLQERLFCNWSSAER